MKRPLLLSIVCAATLIAIVARPGRSADAAATAAVKIVNYSFDPAVLEIKAGTVVTWTNTQDGDHTLLSGTPDAPDKSGPIKGSLPKKGASFSVTFDKPGEYPYFCDYHHKMKGKIVVK
jgi:plastocyanin